MKTHYSAKTLILKIFALLIFAAFTVFVYKCPFKLIFGVDCPGCGLTRAFAAALRLDFAAAFGFHPLFWLLGAEAVYAVLIFLFPMSIPQNQKVEKALWVITLVLLSVVWLYKIFIM